MKLESVKIGRIVNAHGIRGEVRVQPYRQDPQFLTRFKTFYVKGQAVKPTSCHVHKSLVLMKFPGVDDMNTALTYKDTDIYIRRDDPKIPAGVVFDAELLDMEVISDTTGEVLGVITEVTEYPAHDVYTVRGTQEFMIPAVPDAQIQKYIIVLVRLLRTRITLIMYSRQRISRSGHRFVSISSNTTMKDGLMDSITVLSIGRSGMSMIILSHLAGLELLSSSMISMRLCTNI